MVFIKTWPQPARLYKMNTNTKKGAFSLAKKEKRPHQKTLRMSDRIVFILETYRGDSLADSFENLILDCNEKLPAINEKVKQQEQYYEQRKKQIHKELSQLDDVKNDLSYITSAKRYCKSIERTAEREKENLKGKGKAKK